MYICVFHCERGYKKNHTIPSNAQTLTKPKIYWQLQDWWRLVACLRKPYSMQDDLLSCLFYGIEHKISSVFPCATPFPSQTTHRARLFLNTIVSFVALSFVRGANDCNVVHLLRRLNRKSILRLNIYSFHINVQRTLPIQMNEISHQDQYNFNLIDSP